MKYFLILHFIFFAFNSIIAQSVDRIEAIIGDEVVLKSDMKINTYNILIKVILSLCLLNVSLLKIYYFKGY